MGNEFIEIIGGGLFTTTIEIDESGILEPSQSDIDKVERNKELIQRLKIRKGVENRSAKL